MVQYSSSNSPAKNDPPLPSRSIYTKNPLLESGSKEGFRSHFGQSFFCGLPLCLGFNKVASRPTPKIEQKLRRNPLFQSGSKECLRSRFGQSFSSGFPSCIISFDEVVGQPTSKMDQKLRRNPLFDSGSTHFDRRALSEPFLIRFEADFVQVDPLFENNWICYSLHLQNIILCVLKRWFLPIIQRWVELVGV